MFRISIRRGEDALSQAELPDGTYVIGSGERCRIRLPGPGVAGRHAILVLRGGEATVEDMRSGSGTFLGSAPVAGPTAVPPDVRRRFTMPRRLRCMSAGQSLTRSMLAAVRMEGPMYA